MTNIRLLHIVAIAAGLLASGCSGSTKTGDTTLVAIVVTPGNPALVEGNSLTFAATAYLLDGEAKDVTKDPGTTWRSSDTSVLTISADGVSNAQLAGSSEVTASRGGISSPAQLVSVTAAPTPTATPTPAPTATHVLISEVMYDSPGTEPNSEYIELHNPTGTAKDISGWSLGDHGDLMTTPHVFGAGTSVPANGYFTICHQSGGCTATFPTGIFDTNGLFQLVNGGDWLELRDNTNALIDQMAYGTGYLSTKPLNWGTGPTGTAKSVSRKPVDSDGDTSNDWTGSAAASPGAATP